MLACDGGTGTVGLSYKYSGYEYRLITYMLGEEGEVLEGPVGADWWSSYTFCLEVLGGSLAAFDSKVNHYTVLSELINRFTYYGDSRVLNPGIWTGIRFHADTGYFPQNPKSLHIS